MKDGRDALAPEEFHRRGKRRDDEIVAAVVALIGQRRRGMLADDYTYPWPDLVQPQAVDAVHGLVQEHVRTMVLDLRGQDAQAVAVPSEPGMN